MCLCSVFHDRVLHEVLDVLFGRPALLRQVLLIFTLWYLDSHVEQGVPPAVRNVLSWKYPCWKSEII